jgi:hypothetical protein
MVCDLHRAIFFGAFARLDLWKGLLEAARKCAEKQIPNLLRPTCEWG